MPTAASATTPAVSIIVPCYNHARYLGEAVASAVAQTYGSWELIIIDDGSPDETAAVAARLIAAYPEHSIRLIRQPNRGLSASRNAGIAAAVGRYIMPLDADDALVPECLAVAVAALEAHPTVGFVYSDVLMFGAERRRWSGGAYHPGKLLYDNPTVPSTLFRRAAWAATPGFRQTLRPVGYEDWDFWLCLEDAGWQGLHVPLPLVHYRRTAGSMLAVARRYDLELRAQLIRNHPARYPAALLGWARRWYAPPYLRYGLFRSQQVRLLAFLEYARCLTRVAPAELPKTLVRPLFIRLTPQFQARARRLADRLRLTQRRRDAAAA